MGVYSTRAGVQNGNPGYNLKSDRAETTDQAAIEPKVLAEMEAFLKGVRTTPRSLNEPGVNYWEN